MAQASFLCCFALCTLSVVSSSFASSTPESEQDFETLGFAPITQAPTTTTQAPTTTIKPALPNAFTQGFLREVNKDRNSRGVAPLVLNRTLIAVANLCADDYGTLQDANGGCKYDFTGAELAGNERLLGEYGYGFESSILVPGYNDTKLGMDMAEGFGLQSALVDWDNLLYSPRTMHFLQSVWNQTTSVGCDYRNRDDVLFASCVFYPPGNFEIVSVAGTPEMTNPANLRQNVFDRKSP